jgi:outer membrane lipoprotein-sorting protein
MKMHLLPDAVARLRPALRLAACGLAALLSASVAAAAASAPSLELPELMKLLARHPSGTARFTEQRWVHGLDQPLVASGTLTYTPPDRFERRTLLPRPESMVVEGNKVTLSRAGRSRTLELDASPEAQVAVEAVRGALTGNIVVLRKYFKVQVAGDVERWTLDLSPIDRSTSGPLLAVKLSGRRDALDTVETTLAGGDHNVMSIEPAAAASAP